MGHCIKNLGHAAKSSSRVVGIGLLISWGVAALAGFAALDWYAHKAGAGGDIVSRWPADAPIPLANERGTLMIFLHPHCPCSAASLEQLSRVLAKVESDVDVIVWFIRPAAASADWDRSRLRSAAESIADLRVESDIDGRAAGRFGAAISGTVLLYDRNGDLRFRGGITGARGHAGDNAGSDALREALMDRESVVQEPPVFGCPLFDTQRPGQE